MAYSYSVLAPAGADDVTIPAGSVIRYNGVLLKVLQPHNGANATTYWILSAIEYSRSMSYVEPGARIFPDTPDSDIELRSGTASTTLTDKTKSFAVGVMSTINAIITKVNSLTGRVTAVETLAASKAAIDDTALVSTSTTLSASKIVALNATVLSDANTFAANAANAAKAAAISQLAGVDGTQLQALNDLQAALKANSDADGVIATDLLNKVDYSKSQTLTDAQAAQARANIKFDSAVAAAMLVTVGDVNLFDPDAILATALTLN